MKVQDLVKLNLDELETELAKGSFSKSFLDSLLKAEKSDKSPRKGALELIEGAITALDGEQDVPVVKTSGYAVAKGQSIGFRAGIKTTGDVVDVNWPEFKSNDKLLASMLERGLVVKQ
jgi:hypothetical protein